MDNCWSRLKSSDSNPCHDGSTLSSPPPMEPSLSTSTLPLHPSLPTSPNPLPPPPMQIQCQDAITSPKQKESSSSSIVDIDKKNSRRRKKAAQESIRKNKVEEEDIRDGETMEGNASTNVFVDCEQMGSVDAHSKRNEALPNPPTSSVDTLPPSIDVMYKQLDPAQKALIVSFIETQLRKMTDPSEAGPSSEEGTLATVADVTKLGATTRDTIGTEAPCISRKKAAQAEEEEKQESTQKNEAEEEDMESVDTHSERNEALPNPPASSGDLLPLPSRFWSAKKAEQQLENANQPSRDVRDSLPRDVFLSHNSTEKNFIRRLHKDLTKEGVSCFFDEDSESLPLAEEFPRRILEAAETCKIAVCVLSKDFFFRKWPMIELSAFIRAKNSKKNANLKLLPIFFKISPKELSDITEDSEWKRFAESNDRTGNWDAAINEIRRSNGVVLGENGNEVDCRDKVVKAILQKINPSIQLLDFEPGNF